jgi:SagB-type dehydrogenase family enzyme
MPLPTLEQLRYFLKDSIRQQVDFTATDQQLGVSPPPIEKPFAADARRIELARPGQWQGVNQLDLAAAIAYRESRRVFRSDPLALDELAFLLWATQGVRSEIGPGAALRTVPSAGCRHALETYVCALNVGGLERGVYRYLPREHQLLVEFAGERLERKLLVGTLGQAFVARAAAVFVWTAIPYRMEWRYGLAAHKVIALDAGHVCQNLYLACEAVGCGTCAVAAYHQEAMDELLHVDGRDEFTVYLAPVGKVGTGDRE